ncbi:type I-E CRISPR-associated protein Cas5/CasD [Rhodovibrio sodomensis]|uniref:Type I-E CRISPR-associated protein Cas5/CasD n=1 Tax=Rhodovibrio sodomensis TaxID=1088 RepID=A0ABS1DI85_9PROT|nr:type I-E CRISPR-associated protein Cas5/CasD [Rhodovibrio sodomensis]MBK1669095.1 type I-E CRISPR-associated protein Cas5/CasD [Rhodovibrio sodomensis]
MRILRMILAGPMMSFGGVSICERRETDSLPGRSLIAGLLGNALGLDHADDLALQRLQDRLILATAQIAPGASLRDMQCAHTGHKDMNWSATGKPIGRGGHAYTHANGPVRTERDYHAGARVAVALALEPADDAVDIDTLADALEYPARPLFIGRKTCLPSDPLLHSVVDSDCLLAALAEIVPAGSLAEWPVSLPALRPLDAHTALKADRRNWTTRAHGGETALVRGTLGTP